MAAILPLLTTNSSIFISGTVSEGIKNFAPSLRKYFSSVECIDKCSVLQQDTYGIETGLEDVVVYQATGKKSEEVEGMLKSWKSQESVKILETQRKWIVYPGICDYPILIILIYNSCYIRTFLRRCVGSYDIIFPSKYSKAKTKF